MSRIKIDVSIGELNYMREALEHKHVSLMSYLDACEHESKPTLAQVSTWANKAFETEYVKKPHWTQTAKGKKIMAARRRKGQK
jgi:hypothetical protein